MNKYTEKNILDEYQQSMGNDLGKIMYFSWNELNMLSIIFSDFKTLYSSKKCYVVLLNKSAPNFFWGYQRMWWQFMTIGIERLCESNKRRKTERATVGHLIELLEDKPLKFDCQREYEKLKKITLNLRKARHNLYAHYNYKMKVSEPKPNIDGVNIGIIRKSLLQLGGIFNLVLKKYQDSEVPWDWNDDDRGANQVLSSLAMGETFERLLHKYKLNEEAVEQDYDWMKWLSEEDEK